MCLLRNKYDAIWCQRKSSEVKKLVARRTKCKPIVDGVRPISLMPPNVCCFQCDRDVAYAEIEPTKSASVLIRHQHGVAETWVALSASAQQSFILEPYSIQN